MDYGKDVDAETFWPDGNLKRAFCRYWTLRYDGEIKKTYEMEAPKFRDTVEFSKYSLYVKRAGRIGLEKLVLNGLENQDGRLVDLDVDLYLKTVKGKEIKSFVKDQWVQVDGEWFHALRDPFFFPLKYQ